jgi:hypothetical protein
MHAYVCVCRRTCRAFVYGFAQACFGFMRMHACMHLWVNLRVYISVHRPCMCQYYHRVKIYREVANREKKMWCHLSYHLNNFAPLLHHLEVICTFGHSPLPSGITIPKIRNERTDAQPNPKSRKGHRQHTRFRDGLLLPSPRPLYFV